MSFNFNAGFWWDHIGSCVIEEDFDDNDGAVLAVQEHVERHGAIGIHPGGDRSNWRDMSPPVPLVAHDPPGEGEYWRRQRLERERKYSEYQAQLEAIMMSAEAENEARAHAYIAATMAEERWLQEREQERHRQLLRAMKINQSIKPGSGRIWRDMVMINEADEPQLRSLANGGKEVWRGRGYIIFKVLGAFEAMPTEELSGKNIYYHH